MTKEITINVFDYVSDDRISEICEDAIKRAINKHFDSEKNTERILSNAGHGLAQEMINERFGKDAEQIVAKKTLDIIEKLDGFTVFRPASYGSKASAGWECMDRAVMANTGLIDERVKTLIQEVGESAVRNAIQKRFDELACSFETLISLIDNSTVVRDE